MRQILLSLPAALIAALIAALSACDVPPDTPMPAPSVLVTTVRPVRGSLSEIVTAFGAVAPSSMGMQTISVAQPGQITRLLVTPGSAVQAGQALASFALAPTARSTFQQTANALKAAQQQRAHTAQLLTQQLTTSDQLVQADKAVADARDSLAALVAEGAGQAKRTLVAPFSGIVTTITVAQGDRTQPGAPIMTVARAGDIVVSVGVDPGKRFSLAAGQSATIRRLTGGETVYGRVMRFSSALNARTRLVDVDIAFPPGRFLSGEGIEVGIRTRQVDGWVVPHKAVVTANGAPHIFQIAAGKAQAVPVRLLLSSETQDVVSGDLTESRALVVDGAYQLKDGDAVRTKP